MAVGPEYTPGTKSNSGVLLINTTALAADHAALVDWGVSHQFPGAYDQDMILGFYGQDRLAQLPDQMNWKGYWGYPHEQVSIVHWHGPKPGKGLECLVKASQAAGGAAQVDWSKECLEVAEIYRHIFVSAPDQGAGMAQLLQQWQQALTQHWREAGEFKSKQHQRHQA
jgi:hypothetical protein